jgi:lipopolysaccharide biosynthesis glycosyltransferase
VLSLFEHNIQLEQALSDVNRDLSAKLSIEHNVCLKLQNLLEVERSEVLKLTTPSFKRSLKRWLIRLPVLGKLLFESRDALTDKVVPQKDLINVIFSFNETLAKYAPVTMISLYKNHPDCQIDLYIIYNMLSDSVKQLIEDTAKDYGQMVHFVHVDDPWNYDSFTRYSGSFECYFDLVPHRYLPETISRAVYLDVDLFVNRDIRELYFADFDDNYLIGVEDVSNVVTIGKRGKVTMLTTAQGGGVNSGVLVLNFDKFRSENITIENYKLLIEQLNSEGIPYFGDQGLLNSFMIDKKIKYMPPIWNYLFLADELRNTPLKKYSLDDVAIFHCGGNEYKPWNVIFDDNDIDFLSERKYLLKYRVNPISVEINKRWWHYAKFARNYEKLIRDAVSYKNILSVIDFPSIENALARN